MRKFKIHVQSQWTSALFVINCIPFSNKYEPRTWLYPEHCKYMRGISTKVMLLVSAFDISGNLADLVRGNGV